MNITDRQFLQTTEKKYLDTEDMLNISREKLVKSTWLQDAEVFVDGFVFFNPQEMNLLEEILLLARDVQITVCIDDYRRGQNSVLTALFHQQYRTLMDLFALAKKHELPYEVVYLSKPHRFLTGGLRSIADKLFSYPILRGDSAEGVKLVEAANQRLEVEHVAIDIIRLCREEGYRYKDIGIVYREGSYTHLLEAVLSNYQIPFFNDEKRPFTHHALAELLRSTLEALQNWQYEPLIRAFKTGFFPAQADEIDLLENYILAHGIRGKKKWQEVWQYRQRNFATPELSAEEKSLLDKVNEIRERVITPLLQLSEAVNNQTDAAVLTKALYDYLLYLEVPDKLLAEQERAEEKGEMALANEQAQIWNDIIGLFDQIVEACGDVPISRQVYAEVLNDGIENLEISLIPPGFDYVTIASFDTNSLENKKSIYILGVNEGIIPGKTAEGTLFSEYDRLHLEEQGIELSPGAMKTQFFENFLLYKACTLPSTRLTLSYALADGEGKALNRSAFFNKIEKCLPLSKGQYTTVLLENYTEESERRRVTIPKRTLSYLSTALRQYRETKRIAPFWLNIY